MRPLTYTILLGGLLLLPSVSDAREPIQRALSLHRSRSLYSASYQGDATELFGNPFSDDTPPASAPTLAPAPIATPAPAPATMDATPIQIAPAPMQSAPIQATAIGPVTPSCGVAGPSCGVAGPSCGAAAPSCGVAAPACGLPCGNGCSDGCAGCGTYTSCGDGGCGLSSLGCGLGLCDCNLGDACSLNGLLYGDCPPCISVGGWLSAGYHSKGNDLFNSRPDQFALHQAWLYAEKVATGDSPFGFRVDAMYGIDANDTQAFGNPLGSWDFANGFDHGAYGWAIPQLYGEVALTDNWTVKAGHFYTLVGYEVVTAPDNFFYSHAMTMYNSEPFTHTGVLATGSISDSLTIYAGWTLGWDSGFDQLNDGSSWLGGFGYALGDNASFTYVSTGGNFGWRGDDAYSHSLLLDMTLTDNLNYVVQSDLVRVDSTGEDNVGLNQYLLYSVSDCLGFGARMEWWKGDVLTGYAPHGGTLPAAGSLSYYAATFGANVRPHANVVIRPEVRIDWSPAADYDESYFGVDAIFTF